MPVERSLVCMRSANKANINSEKKLRKTKLIPMTLRKPRVTDDDQINAVVYASVNQALNIRRWYDHEDYHTLLELKLF
ncbi:hypothetical protein RRF57_003952 [Xylaria bambusicola]|uniref:Uncharacterized protein n=1 Tax=Xylaria bambusicola TaxID=326684 RepID=A0AAN7Z3X9_9PEZI